MTGYVLQIKQMFFEIILQKMTVKVNGFSFFCMGRAVAYLDCSFVVDVQSGGPGSGKQYLAWQVLNPWTGLCGTGCRYILCLAGGIDHCMLVFCESLDAAVANLVGVAASGFFCLSSR